MAEIQLDHWNEKFNSAQPKEILAWAWEQFRPHIAASSSFQTQSVPLLKLISEVCPEMPVVFLDTGFHFLDTLHFRDDLQKMFNLNIRVIKPVMDKEELFKRYGNAPYQTNPDLCCYINKVEPMRRAVEGLQGWISGVRRDQTAQRNNLNVFERQPDGLIRIHPMLNWTRKDLWDYIKQHKLPYHPLHSQGYVSIGCAPCTRPVMPGEDERAGRWAGQQKTECGLHYEI